MVQSQLSSPVQGARVSASRGSMWPVLVVGILTAIIAWIWYRGSGDNPVQKQTEVIDPAETEQDTEESQHRPVDEQQAPKESSLPAAEPLATKESGLPAAEPLDTSESSLPAAVHLATKESNLHSAAPLVTKGSSLPAAEPLATKGSSLPAAEPLDTSESSLPAAEPLDTSEASLPAAESLDTSEASLHSSTPLVRKESALPAAEPLDTSEFSLPAADPESCEPTPCEQDLSRLDVQGKKVVNQEVYPSSNEEQSRLQVREQSHVDHLTTGLEVQINTTATNVPLNVSADLELQGDTQKSIGDVSKEQELHGDLREPLIDVQRQQDLGAEHPEDVPMKEADTQEHPAYISKEEELQASLLGHQTSDPAKGDRISEQHLEIVLQTSAEEPYNEPWDKKDEIHSQEDVHPSDIPEAGVLLINREEVYPPLEKELQLGTEEQYLQDDLDKAKVQGDGERWPTLMAEGHAGKSEQGKECLPSATKSLDGVCENGEGDGAKQAAENTAGCPLENSFVEKENAVNVLKDKQILNQDLYLEMIRTSSDDVTQESVERCDIKRMCSTTVKTDSQDDFDEVASHLNESTRKGLSNAQKQGTGTEASPLDTLGHMFNQEKEIAHLNSTNTEEKTFFGISSEVNIHDIDHQKTRKVATIQPMPQNVNVAFKVHYITHSDSQVIAVTGDHEKLGKWETYIPLTSGNGGFWSHSVTLPADATLAWKFVMVENGKIKRWEECNNRFLKTAHEDIEGQLYWGYP